MADKSKLQPVIQYRPVLHQAFPASANQDWLPNLLMINIQPDEGITLHFQAKHPRVDFHLSSEEMRFRYSEAFQTSPPEAYETLLQDSMGGDATLFMRADQVMDVWGVIAPELEVWLPVAPSDFPNYPSGTWGPPSAEALIAQDGRRWFQPKIIDQPKSGG
jgi:glucose-6-phosphate 1-dehydrogenase